MLQYLQNTDTINASKACQISKMMRHTENPGIIRTVYSGIFREIQQY